jgi:hypothetical protein
MFPLGLVVAFAIKGSDAMNLDFLGFGDPKDTTAKEGHR